jgi:phosphatidylglycerol---prolipoprotein diacylglyceryl transferase
MRPILFQIGPITVHGYGLMVALGLLLCFPVLRSEARRRKLFGLSDNLASLYLWMLVAGFIGGKLFYAWSSAEEFERIKATRGLMATMGNGFVFYGSLLTCLPVLWWWLRKRNLAVLPSVDTMILAAPIMLGLGRIGCFLSGCCHGCRVEPEHPLAVTFERGQGINGVPLHPAQLYETFGCAVVFAILWFFARRRDLFPGFVTAVYFVLYGIERIVVEFFRGDSVRGYIVGGADLKPGDPPPLLALAFSQAISLLVIAAGVIWLVIGRRRIRVSGESRKAGTATSR